MTRRTNRRDFLRASAAAGAGFYALAGLTPQARAVAPNDKLNVAFIGVGGMGEGNLNGVAGCGENIVAVCDVDAGGRGLGNKSVAKHPKAKQFADYRKMFDEMGKDFDAVVVSTPDHSHAPAAMLGLRAGKHVYCEKPLTWSVAEARMLRTTARERKVATQMGNRGTSEGGFRSGVEFLQSGALGDVAEAHIWSNRPIWPQGMDRPKSKDAPNTLSWDLWLGPAAPREYHDGLHPFAWRGWLDFGTGALGDMACHTCNLTFMGLKLGYPTSVSAALSELNKESFPKWSTITFQFPARDKMPALKLVWYDGKKTDKEQNLPPEEIIKGLEVYGKDKKALPVSGCVLLGSKGVLFSPDDYGSRQILLSGDRKEMPITKPEPTLPRSPGHYQEWVNACKGGKPCLSNFDYAGLLTESILLGVVAMRAGKKIDWDGENMRVTNVADANQYLRREYRKGWTL